jgi:hypothetical protein
VKLVGQAGFRAVVNGSLFDGTTAQQILAYADAAGAAGVQVVWPLNAIGFAASDPNASDLLTSDSALASTCGCTTNQGLLAYVIALATSRSNTWGYYLADEPMPADHDRLQAFVQRVQALDSTHPRLVMGCGICRGGDPTGANISFLSDLNIALGTDAYPVRGATPDPRLAYAGVAQNSDSLRTAGARTGQGTVVALQAWRWGDSDIDVRLAGLDPALTRFPTAQEIQAQRDAAIDHAHPNLILWFDLYDVIGWEPGQRPSYWAQPPDTAQRWQSLVAGAFAAPAVPVPSFTVQVAGRGPAGVRLVANASSTSDPEATIVGYRWTLNGRPLPGCGGASCSFTARRHGGGRLGLVVLDDHSHTGSAVAPLPISRRGGGASQPAGPVVRERPA